MDLLTETLSALARSDEHPGKIKVCHLGAEAVDCMGSSESGIIIGL